MIFQKENSVFILGTPHFRSSNNVYHLLGESTKVKFEVLHLVLVWNLPSKVPHGLHLSLWFAFQMSQTVMLLSISSVQISKKGKKK